MSIVNTLSLESNRQIKIKVEKPENQMVYMYTFVVTNMDSSPAYLIKFYCKRGLMENFIKGGKEVAKDRNYSFSPFLRFSFQSNFIFCPDNDIVPGWIMLFKQLV